MGNRARAASAHKRNGFWYLIRRVPKEFKDVDKRSLVLLTTGIRVADDPKCHRAAKVVGRLDADLLQRWRDLKAGNDPEAGRQYVAAVERARDVGVTYLEAAEVADLPLAALTTRVAKLGNPTRQAPMAVAAVLGGVARPTVKLSALRKEYEAFDDLVVAGKSPRQLHRWRTGRDAAVTAFLDAIGSDKALSALTRDDVLAFRSALKERAKEQEITIDTANKQMGQVAAMVRALNEGLMLGLPPIFDKVMLKGAKTNQRIPYTVPFVQERLLADGVFDDVNEEARRVLYLMAETGLRLSEACNLNEATIVLDHAVPHVRVRGDGRQMKTEQSERDIPLVGVALMAMRLQPKGFPRYHDKADSLSALMNKVLDARKLRPNGETMYSLRHTFKDRLRTAGTTDELKDALMGHKRYQPAYGFGYSLESKAEVLRRMAFKPPPSV